MTEHCDIIQRGHRITERWCRTVGLSISSDKTAVVPFTRKRSLKNFKKLYVDRKEILPSQEVKYLGIILDRNIYRTGILRTLPEKPQRPT